MSLDMESFSKEIKAFDNKRLEEELAKLKSLEGEVANCERIQLRIYLLEKELRNRD